MCDTCYDYERDMLAMTQLLTNYVSYIGVRSHSWFTGSCPCAIKDGGWKEPVMDHPMLVVMKKSE